MPCQPPFWNDFVLQNICTTWHFFLLVFAVSSADGLSCSGTATMPGSEPSLPPTHPLPIDAVTRRRRVSYTRPSAVQWMKEDFLWDKSIWFNGAWSREDTLGAFTRRQWDDGSLHSFYSRTVGTNTDASKTRTPEGLLTVRTGRLVHRMYLATFAMKVWSNETPFWFGESESDSSRCKESLYKG